MRTVGLIAAIKQSSWEDWKETLYWLGFNVLGGLFPTWSSALLLRMRGQQLVYSDFAKHGEFALYSAAFLAPALLVIFRYAKRNRYVLGAGSGLMAVSGLLVSALVYATAASAAATPTEHSIDMAYLVAFSTGLLVFSLIVALLVAFVENQATNFNLQEVESRQQEELRTKFEKKLEGTDGGN
jgi:hypothetical protein